MGSTAKILEIPGKLDSPPWIINAVGILALVVLSQVEGMLAAIYVYVLLPTLQLLAAILQLKEPWRSVSPPSLRDTAVVIGLFVLGSIAVAVIAERNRPPARSQASSQ